MPADEILPTPQVSIEYGIPQGTLRFWRSKNEGPKCFRLGRNIVYRRSAIEEWIAAQEVATARGGIRV
ncbi:helix-turn-helix transcriptional regulator [Williamsia limnetica]|uniref:helix-turn-helix transcriptional regulator n=1 Tax=Williamsia limnetica TaxID=882452 RepID=UPI000D7C32C9|nr:helix-turn-helix domain-containing protein [Williamsia limnetica]